ncbi:hypothetical protein [Jannaschia seohaensis]|uniref:Uncharacterized protein n=1 Tax=Jannaschia seohaensis TaxID=475081 RepID=A0A2Y9AAM8_9RHOB|nr:hypothetical protein [Jannaschia seohaensis]PWJ20815.1 hypothetical protein BCF38_10261 [Jannaschia seohaensis]SSA41225.1 hypothetical protein SAMN05421539_10261 [Jannaschia seohaensis]
MFVFSRIALFITLVAGWFMIAFGGWIAWRGLTFYGLDHVLVGTGGGILLGGLLVVALSVGANAQLSTARDTAALRRLAERRPPPAEEGRKGRRGDVPSLRAEPVLPPRKS